MAERMAGGFQYLYGELAERNLITLADRLVETGDAGGLAARPDDRATRLLLEGEVAAVWSL